MTNTVGMGNHNLKGYLDVINQEIAGICRWIWLAKAAPSSLLQDVRPAARGPRDVIIGITGPTGDVTLPLGEYFSL